MTEENDHLSGSATDDDDTITMGETSRKRKLPTTSPNQEDGYSLELSLERDVDTGESSRKRKLTTRSPPNQEDGLSLELSLGLPNASSTQEDQPAMQNPNQDEEEKVEEVEEEDEDEEEEEAVEEVEQEVEEAPAPAPAPAPIPVFMFEKVLTYSDVARNPNRLLIIGSHVNLIGYLTEEEIRRAYRRRDFLRVVTTETNNGVDYILHIKRWYGAGALVLKHEWGKLVRANGLRIGDSVVVRGYRVDGEFRLLLNIIRNHLFD